MKTYWKRTCQECSHVRRDKVKPNKPEESQIKCPRCKSQAYDFGYLIFEPETAEEKKQLEE